MTHTSTDMSVNEVVARAATAVFGQQLITNVYRALLVEAMLSAALCPDWQWCAADYFAFDFQHIDKTRLEVKQSAARQSWPSPKPSTIRWDIAERDGFWEGAVWVPAPGRNADIYVLAHHPGTDEGTDHRDPQQWEFFVIDVSNLPATKTISLATVQGKNTPVRFDAVRDAVEKIRTTRARTAANALI